MEENLGAVAVDPTLPDLGEIESAAAGITVHGSRYSSMERQSNR
jgi:hypothetical protein